MKTVADYLRNAPKGTKLYSPICGECTLHYIDDLDISVTNGEHYFYFNHLGQYNVYEENVGECLLFPSKEVREWNNYRVPYDFKPYDKIVARFRPSSKNIWQADFYSHRMNKVDHMGISGNFYSEVLPFNTETAKLIGTNISPE